MLGLRTIHRSSSHVSSARKYFERMGEFSITLFHRLCSSHRYQYRGEVGTASRNGQRGVEGLSSRDWESEGVYRYFASGVFTRSILVYSYSCCRNTAPTFLVSFELLFQRYSNSRNQRVAKSWRKVVSQGFPLETWLRIRFRVSLLWTVDQ